MNWIAFIILSPLVALLVVSGWAVTSLFILWIACLMAAVLVACIVFLLIERAAFYVQKGISWLKN